MPTQSDKELLVGALKVANRIRKFLGLPPVNELYSGNSGDGWSCPVTNTIYDDDLDRERFTIRTGYSTIGVTDLTKGKKEKCYRNTKAGSAFVSAFDGGSLRDEFPDLYKSDHRIKIEAENV